MGFVSYKSGYAERISNGTPLDIVDLKYVLEKECLNKDNINKKKGYSGGICAYTSNELGKITSTGGVIFMDFDKVPRIIIDKFIENFDDLSTFCGPLLSFNTSHSYNNKSKNECGLHVYFKSLSFSGENVKDDYKECAVKSLAYFCRCAKLKLDIDLSPYVDAHNTSINQRFFLNYGLFKYNEYATPLTENSLTKDQWKKLEEEYPEIFKELKKLNRNKSNSGCGNDSVKAVVDKDGYVIKEIESQRTTYPTHEERYKMVNVRYVEGYSYDEIYDEQLAIRIVHGGKEDVEFKRDMVGYWNYAKDHIESLTTQQYDQGRRLLREFGRISVKKDGDAIEIPNGKYLTHFLDFILDEYKKHGRILIQAPTGAGKTTLMKILAKKDNGDILVPFNSMLGLYCERKKDEYGRDIQPDILDVGTYGRYEYNKDKSNCMVWDRGIKHDSSNKLVIIDESHEMFTAQTYRPAAIEVMKRAKTQDNLICISATPAGEVEKLGLHVIKFYKERNIIPVRWVNCMNSGGFIKNFLDKRELHIKHVVFSDTNASRLYENFPGSCLLHSKMRDNPDFKYVLEEELLNNDLTFCTTIAYCGVNFDNEDKYRVIVEVREGEDTANKIIQAVGRLRNAEIVEVVVVFPIINNSNKRSIEDLINDNLLKKDVCENIDTHNSVNFEEKFTEEDSREAQRDVAKYISENSSKEDIISGLMNVGYFSIKEEWNTHKYGKLELIKNKESNLKFKEYIRSLGGNLLNVNYADLDEYSRPWYKSMMKMDLSFKVDWIEALDGWEDGVSMNTIIRTIWERYDVCRLSKEVHEQVYSKEREIEILNWKDKDGKGFTDIEKKNIVTDFKRRRKIYEEYELCCTEKETDSFEVYLEDFLGHKAIEVVNAKELKKKGGKKGGKKGKKVTIEDNKGKLLEFDTVKDAANKFDLSEFTMRSYIEQGEFEVVIKHKKCLYRIVNQ